MYILCAQLDAHSPLCIPVQSTVSNYKSGTSIIQNTLFGDQTAIQQGQEIIYNSSHFVNQHLMGFGALNPEPSDNNYNLQSLEQRIGITNGVVKDANQIVLTACCSPDWMKGGLPGDTDWSKIEFAPLQEHYQDYADLVVYVVQQAEFQNIKYIQVWNEMKGFWNPALNRWNYEGYTTLYNLIWNGVKAVRPDIKIGGPYVVVNSYLNPNGVQDSGYGGPYGTFDKRDLDVIEYWLEHKVGADFIIVDGKLKNRDQEPASLTQWEHAQKFADFSTWLHSLQYPDAQDLPVWWAEWYIGDIDDSASQKEVNALMAVSLVNMIKSGVETALLWSAQGDINGQIPNLNHQQLALFTDTANPSGGKPTLFEFTQRLLNTHFSTGTQLYELPSSNPVIETLIGKEKILLINTTNTATSTVINNTIFTVNPHEVKLIDTPTELRLRLIAADECNFIYNGRFDDNLNGWTFENCTATIDNNQALISSIAAVNNPWDAKFIFSDLCLSGGVHYSISFDAFASQARIINIKIGEQQIPYSTIFSTNVHLSQTSQHFIVEFMYNSPDDLTRIEFQVGQSQSPISISNVRLTDLSCLDCPSILHVSEIDGLTSNKAANQLISDAVITSPQTVEFQASYNIELIPGFEVEEQALFSAFISSCE